MYVQGHSLNRLTGPVMASVFTFILARVETSETESWMSIGRLTSSPAFVNEQNKEDARVVWILDMKRVD